MEEVLDDFADIQQNADEVAGYFEVTQMDYSLNVPK